MRSSAREGRTASINACGGPRPVRSSTGMKPTILPSAAYRRDRDRGPVQGPRGLAEKREPATISCFCAADGNPTYRLAVVVDDHDMGGDPCESGRHHLSMRPARADLRHDGMGHPNSRISR